MFVFINIVKPSINNVLFNLFIYVFIIILKRVKRSINLWPGSILQLVFFLKMTFSLRMENIVSKTIQVA